MTDQKKIKSARPVLYFLWANMKQRCLNKKHRQFKDYGGRGITVCESWLKFDNFLQDMGEKPKNKSLDRIDNNGNYCKENCRWASSKEQARNTRQNFLLKGKTLSEWSEILKIKRSTLAMRHYFYGWSDNEVLSKNN